MANPSKARGTNYESSLLPLLRKYYPYAERRAQQGALDMGDFNLGTTEQRYILEAKCCAKQDLPKWIGEAKREAQHYTDSAYRRPPAVGVVVAKRRGKTDPAEQWVHMTLGDFLHLVNT